MSARILDGSPDNNQLPKESLGNIFYNTIRKFDPSRTLLIDSTNEEVSYGSLLQVSVKLAKRMRDLGVNKGDVITIISQNQWKYLATGIAGLYIGAAVNLLNPDYTAGELRHFLATCQPVLIFCTTKSFNNLVQLKEEMFFPANIISYDADSETMPKIQNFDEFLDDVDHDEIFNPVELDPTEDVAFILTSSGTTGLPKCVQLTHSNFRISMIYGGDPYSLDISDRETLIGFMPFFHILGIIVGFGSILYGAKLVLLEKFIPDVFLHTIQEHKITKLYVVPPILLFLVKSPLLQRYDLSSIKDVVTAAAASKRELEELVSKQLGGATVRQAYGMTETCGACTIIPKNIIRYASCGLPTTTHHIKVCDTKTGHVLAPNKIGEIRVKGDGVMKGYLPNSMEKQEVFDENGFLKSGDLGYYDDEGFLYAVDRLKEMIKYKGFQVSPVELENLLIQHPAVKDVGVVGKLDEKAGEVPVAFVVKHPNQKITEEELANYVAENISVQKHLHGGIRFIEEIPKSSTGKILRTKLKELL